MAANRTEIKKAQDRAAIERLCRQRVHINEIATRLGINRKTVLADLKWLQRQWQAESLRNYSQAKAEQLAKLDELVREAWEGFERCRREEVSERTRVVEGPQGRRTTLETRRQPRDGGLGYLSQVCRCLEERAKLLGLYAPSRATVPPPAPDPDDPTLTEFMALLREADARRRR